MKDLGLSYEAAAHGVQSAIGFEMGKKGLDPDQGVGRELKHQRTGIDMQKSDLLGFAELLISKGVFTVNEYVEYMRLAANTELAMHEEKMRKEYGNIGVSFR